MGKKWVCVAGPEQDAGEACTSTKSSHVNNDLPSTTSRSSRGFPSFSSNPYHPSPSSEANSAPVADFSAPQHRGGSTHEQSNAPLSPQEYEIYIRAYHEGYVNGYCQAMSSNAAAAQVGPPPVPVAPAIVPSSSVGARLQPYASSILPHSATSASSSPPHQVLPATGAEPVVHSQAPDWGSGHISQRFGRNRNPPALPNSQLDTLGIASTSAPQALVLLSSPTHCAVVVPQPISGHPLSSQGDNESHECTWVECGKSFRRRYLLEDHVAYTHHGTKRHTCPAEGCGNKYAARAGLMKHVKKHHQGLVGTPVLCVDDVG